MGISPSEPPFKTVYTDLFSKLEIKKSFFWCFHVEMVFPTFFQFFQVVQKYLVWRHISRIWGYQHQNRLSKLCMGNVPPKWGDKKIWNDFPLRNVFFTVFGYCHLFSCFRPFSRSRNRITMILRAFESP